MAEYNSSDECDSEYDYEEVFIRFDSKTKNGGIDYIMLGSTCYQVDDMCYHEIVMHFLDGEIEQATKNKKELLVLFQENGISILEDDELFAHLIKS